jgi:hypothetical protein
MPPGSAISIIPSRWLIELDPDAGCGEENVFTESGGIAITLTRANLATGWALVPSDPSSRCRRHV